MASGRKQLHPMPLLALFLAWAIPGAGHAYLGRRRRGAIVFVMIGATFWAGVAMGGVLTVDHYQERWWFVADMFTGVHGLVSWYRQDRVYERLTRDPEIGAFLPPTHEDASLQYARIQEKLAEEGLAIPPTTASVARVYAGVAGMLNLMCIFDAMVLALMGVTGEPAAGRRADPDRPEEKDAPA